MKTQTQQAAYQEALAVLSNYDREISSLCDSATLSGYGGVWRVVLNGPKSHGLTALIAHLGAVEQANTLHRGEHYWIHTYACHRGRVRIEVCEAERIIRRVNGVTGADETVGGLW